MIFIFYIGFLHAALNGLSKEVGHKKWDYKIKMNGEEFSKGSRIGDGSKNHPTCPFHCFYHRIRNVISRRVA